MESKINNNYLVFILFVFMALIVFPILLILNEEKYNIPLSLLFLPLTLSWILLIAATGLLFIIAKRVKNEIVVRLCQDEKYNYLPKVKGRKFKHPVFWQFHYFLSKALFFKCLFLILIYPGIFIKTTINSEMTYLNMALISWIPTGGVICIKQIYDIFLNIKQKHLNSLRIRQKLKKAVEESLSGEIDFSSIKKMNEKSEKGNIDPPLTNPRDIKYKDVKSC